MYSSPTSIHPNTNQVKLNNSAAGGASSSDHAPSALEASSQWQTSGTDFVPSASVPPAAPLLLEVG